MPISVTFQLNTSKRYSDAKELVIMGTCSYSFMTQGETISRVFRFSTKQKCPVKQFKGGRVKPSAAGATLINSKLAALSDKAKQLYDSFTRSKKFPAAEIFKSQLLNETIEVKEERNFFDDFDRYVNYLINRGASQYGIYNVKQTVNHIKSMLGKSDVVDYSMINLEFYARFMSYCRRKNLKPNTSATYIKLLKTFLNWATANGWNQYFFYKHRDFAIREESIPVVALNENEVEAIEKADLSDRQAVRGKGAQTVANWLEITRDYFVLACEFGLRFSDYCQIRKHNIEEVPGEGYNLKVKTKKTGAFVTIPISARAMAILKRYNFELPEHQSNQKFNENLKTIVALVKVNKPINSHSGRKTFATTHERIGTPRPWIMRITGHKTEKEYLKYVGIDGAENAEMVRKQHATRYAIEKTGLLNNNLKIA